MTGYDLAKALQRSNGKLFITMNTPHCSAWVLANKQDVIQWAKRQTYAETGLTVGVDTINGVLYLEEDASNSVQTD